MSKKFSFERDGQLKFFEKFAIADTRLANNTDGVYKGTFFEFKKTIPDINVVLFQAIKYLSHMRIKGQSIPANILLVALNEEVAYLFKSDKYLKEIEIPYAGAASKNNSGFSARTKPVVIKYDSPVGIGEITKVLEDESFVKINIDVFDVVGWATRFYQENPTASKISLFKELRNPKYFSRFIYPWTGDEGDFKYIMDLLNDKQHKKELGAFYTPPLYCLKATELVRKAIKQIPKGHDYIILDRCAGTGNLEEFLTDKAVDDIFIGELNKYIDRDFRKKYLASVNDGIDLILEKTRKNLGEITLKELKKYETFIKIRDYIFDNELSHTIINTYELKEWIVLNERIGDRVKLIIPPPQEVDNKKALVNGGDALGQQFVTGKKSLGMTKEYNESIDKLLNYVSDAKTNIILYENPPFRDESSNSHMQGGSRNSFVKKLMREKVNGSLLNDLSNQFVWSAWEYYLRKSDDYYILFSPIKYWKSGHLSDKKFMEGYVFNRQHFHANSPSAITCLLWQNKIEKRETIKLNIVDIVKNENNEDVLLDKNINILVKKVYDNLSKLYDKRTDKNDLNNGIVCSLNGLEDKGERSRVIKKFNENIIGYLVAQQFGFENPRLSTNLTRCAIYNGNGFFLREDNFVEKLPLFVAGKMPIEKFWHLNGIIFKTSDGGISFVKDKNFIKSCLMFSCLSYFNKCRSLNGSDGRFYKNELCFDKGTIASKKLNDYKLTPEEKDLKNTFNEMLLIAKDKKEHNSKYTYGTYQIDDEINIYNKTEDGEIIYKYPELNTKINELKTKLAKYYETTIQPKLFEYELLK